MKVYPYLQVVSQFIAIYQTVVYANRGGTSQPGHIPGCQSTNHIECYGELWECTRCGKKVCCAEGTDEEFDLCDDCWAQQNI